MKLHQSAQFIPTQPSISLLLSGYGLQLIGYQLADSGIENCTIIIQTVSDSYVLRVYRQHKKSDEHVRRELDFVAYLKKNSVPVAPPIANLAGDFISHLEKDGYLWQAILMQLMPGSHADYYSDELLADLAIVQANMHNLAASYQANDAQKENLTELRETHFITLIPNRETLDSLQKDFVDRAETYVVHFNSSLPSGLCHLDFDNGNVLSKNDRVTAVLDFDDLMYAPYIMCLAYTLWDIAFRAGPEKATGYANQYSKIRTISDLEKGFVTPIILFRHYVIGCKDMVDGQMTDKLFERYAHLESELLEDHMRFDNN